MSDIVPADATPHPTPTSDHALDVPADWYAAMRLAGRIHNTPFVKKGMRGDPSTVLACILTGQELGLGPMQSLQGIHVIEGTPALAAETMRALVNRDGHLFKLVELDTKHCVLYGKRRDTGADATITYTIQDAAAAGLTGKQVWKAHTRAMLLARATSLLCRALFADVIKGLSYTPEETAEIAGVPWEPDAELIDPVTATSISLDEPPPPPNVDPETGEMFPEDAA